MTIKYSYDDQYFTGLDLQPCYWAGFIAADGCICARDKALIIVSKKDDGQHIQKFADSIRFNGTVKVNNGGGYKPGSYNRLAIYGCIGIIKDLEQFYGITPRKTKILTGPTIQDFKQRLAFFAGFVDGDGSIYETPKGPQISIGGTKTMMEWCKTLVDQAVPPTKPRNIRATKHAWFHEYKVTSDRALVLGSIIHALDLPLMERKWQHVKD